MLAFEAQAIGRAGMPTVEPVELKHVTLQRKKPSTRYADIHRKRPCMWQCSVPGGYVLIMTEVSNY